MIFLRNELKRVQYKILIKNFSVGGVTKDQYVKKLNQMNRNNSKVRIKTLCVLTGRGKAVYRFCKLSRIRFRELAAQKLLFSVPK